jgi:hypothetical protein
MVGERLTLDAVDSQRRLGGHFASGAGPTVGWALRQFVRALYARARERKAVTGGLGRVPRRERRAVMGG